MKTEGSKKKKKKKPLWSHNTKPELRNEFQAKTEDAGWWEDQSEGPEVGQTQAAVQAPPFEVCDIRQEIS